LVEDGCFVPVDVGLELVNVVRLVALSLLDLFPAVRCSGCTGSLGRGPSLGVAWDTLRAEGLAGGQVDRAFPACSDEADRRTWENLCLCWCFHRDYLDLAYRWELVSCF
jgi:hypothetical protein